MMSVSRRVVALAVVSVSLFTPALDAAFTGGTGESVPFDNRQPTLALTALVRTTGAFDTVGDIAYFAGNFAPAGFALANGQSLPVNAGTTALYARLGTTYGGDATSFKLPDLTGRVVVGADATTVGTAGTVNGASLHTLTLAQEAVHSHSYPGSNTSTAGAGQSYSNLQASLALNYKLALFGGFPLADNGGTTSPFVGEVRATAASVDGSGSVLANGVLLNLNAGNSAVSILGTTFGGNGTSNFAVPNTLGRTVIGAGQGMGLTNRALGAAPGTSTTTLTVAQLPAHTHTLPAGYGASTTGSTGSSAPVDNLQPSLALNYVIALNGVYPSEFSGADDEAAFVGEVKMFAGNFAPAGFALCDGSLLSIDDYSTLYTLIGTTYGGDGVDTFALPDLRGHAVVGAGYDAEGMPYGLGSEIGVESYTLGVENLAFHLHSIPTAPLPEPDETIEALSIAGGVAFMRRRSI